MMDKIVWNEVPASKVQFNVINLKGAQTDPYHIILESTALEKCQ